MPVTPSFHRLTHSGRVREATEDHFLVAELSKSLLITQATLPAENHTRLFDGPPGQLLLY